MTILRTIAALVSILCCSAIACVAGERSYKYSPMEIATIKQLLSERCLNEATEVIHRTISTDSLYLMPNHKGGEYATVLAVFRGHAGPVVHAQGHQFLFGQIKTLRTVEYDLDTIHREVYGAKYIAREVRSHNEEKRNEIKSRYAVKIQDLTSPEQESLRILGQQITILDLQTGEEIAINKSFFWTHRDPYKGGVVIDSCSKDANEDYSVGDFVKKVFAQ